MANGGMGDGLTGIISSLAGQHYSLLESAKIGAFLEDFLILKINSNYLSHSLLLRFKSFKFGHYSATKNNHRAIKHLIKNGSKSYLSC